MTNLINLFVNLCLLKTKPQDLPVSEFLVLLLAAVHLVGGTLVIIVSFGSFFSALLAQLLDIVLVVLVFKITLQLTGKPERFLQAAAALFGSGILINMVSVPLLLLMPEVSVEGQEAVSGPWALLYLILIMWAITIGAHIVRHTFDIPFAAGVIFSVGYFLLINALLQPILVPGAA